MGLSLYESEDGSKSVSDFRRGVISFRPWSTLEAMHPELAHLYDDLAVECVSGSNDYRIIDDYVDRAAQRLLV